MTRSNLHKYTVAGTMYRQNTVIVMLRMDLNVGRRRKKEEEEGGVTGLILQPLWWRPEEWSWDRAGPLIRDREKWNKTKQKKTAVEWESKQNQFSRTLQQFIFRNFLYWKKKKKKKEREQRGGNRGEIQWNCAQCTTDWIWICLWGILPLKTGVGGGVGWG